MRAWWLLLPALAAGLTVTNDRYLLQPYTTFKDPAVDTVRAMSVHQCAFHCSAMTPDFCDGFRYVSGDCQLLSNRHHCLQSATRAAGDPASYRRYALTRSSRLCGDGWIAFDGSCYRRSAMPQQDRDGSNALCQADNPCSTLASVSSQVELSFVLYHWSRPLTNEWIAARLLTGIWKNQLDGTQLPASATVSGWSGCCLATQDKHISPTLLRHTTLTPHSALCEAVRPPGGPPAACPPGWLLLDIACYTFRPEILNHSAADTFCSTLEDGARLGHPALPGHQQILIAFVAQNSDQIERFWVGLSDLAVEGDWRAMDGSVPFFFWSATRTPGKLNPIENCLLLDVKVGVAYDKECFVELPFICQVAANQIDLI